MKIDHCFKSSLLIVTLSTLASYSLLAQEGSMLPSLLAGEHQPGGPGGPRHHPPSPLMEALDTNHDGVLSAEEIANAAAALKKLDKNDDGQLTEDELRPPPPPGTESGPPQRPPRAPGCTGSVCPQQQHAGSSPGSLPPDWQEGPAAAEVVDPEQTPSPSPASVASHAPATARAIRPPRLAEDPVILRLDPSATSNNQSRLE